MRQIKIRQSYTNRSEESLDRYLVEISRMPLISPEQEVELAQTIRKGGREGQEAKEKLVTSNLRFVVSVAKQYQHQGVPLTDLINEGNLGLMTAADKFDETRGFKFISYAIWWIRQSILQAIGDYSHMVRRPLSQIAISNTIKNATNEFVQGHQVNYESMCSDLMQVLESVLNFKELTIIVQSFGIGCAERGLEDIGHDLGLTRERVRQIRERGLDKVRKSKKSSLLLKHLGS